MVDGEYNVCQFFIENFYEKLLFNFVIRQSFLQSLQYQLIISMYGKAFTILELKI